MKRTAKALFMGASFWLVSGCGGSEVEASGFARAPTPRKAGAAEVPAGELARGDSGTGGAAVARVASDRPVVRAEAPAVEEPPPSPGPGAGEAAPEAAGDPTDGLGLAAGASPASAEEPGGSGSGEEALAYALLERGPSAEAARAFSDLIQGALVPDGGGEDPVALARWVQALDQAQARYRWRASGAWPSVSATVQPGEGLIVLRKRVLSEHPDLLTCTGQIARANQLPNPDALQPGDVLRVPVEHANMLVDLSARWAFYRFGDEIAAAWPVGIGKTGQETPPGEYKVGLKQERPPWHPRGRPMVAFGDPENPLGSHWVGWLDENGRTTDIGFHGTTDESGVGHAVSRGCLRLRNADVAVLHDTLPQGTRITVQP